jgi:adenylate cyclase
VTGPHLELHRSGGHLIALDGRHWSVGRSADNTIVIDDVSISRKHAMLQRMEGDTQDQLFLIDLGSRNGTFVNDRRVTVPTSVRDGDRLRFGLVESTFHWPDGVRPETMVIEGPDTSFVQMRRLITVLVTDIRDYTGLTRRTDEQVLSRLMAEWFRLIGNIVHAAGGYVDKHIGDAVMAVWFHGTEGVEPQDLLRIARALTAINTATDTLHHTFALPAPIRIAAGLNTGYAVIGNTGTAARPDYTALGDTVNAAFRIESATRVLGSDVAIGEATWQQLHRALISQDETATPGNPGPFARHRIELKGYDEPLTVYTIDFPKIATLLPSPER